MARTKRNRQQLANDRLEICRLYLRGLTQAEIAERMGISQPQISYDLRIVREQWRATALTELSGRLAEEAARLDFIEREHWAAWNRSKEGDLDGNPRFLKGVMQCVMARVRLFALDKPQKVEIVTREEVMPEVGYLDLLTVEELEAMRAIIAKGEERMKVQPQPQLGAPGTFGGATG